MDPENNDGLDLFDSQPMDVYSEDESSFIEMDNDFLEGRVSEDIADESGNQNNGQGSGTNDDVIFDDELPAGGEPAEEKKDDIDFEDDSLTKAEDQDTFKEEEAIQKLKDLGYEIKGATNNDPLQIKQQEIGTISAAITNLTNVIQKDDMSLCRQKVTQDLLADYKRQNRTVDPNSEEFRLEIEEQMQDYQYNQKLASLEANAIRTDLKAYIAEQENKKQGLEKEIESEVSEKSKIHRNELKTSFKSYNNKTLFGQKIDADLIKSAYGKITSGEISKQINSDKSIQAEVALYLEVRQQVLAAGGATYGEGVAAAVKALNGGQGPKTETSLAKTVDKRSSGNTLQDRYSSWGAQFAVEKPQ